jgi:hypothetical protein
MIELLSAAPGVPLPVVFHGRVWCAKLAEYLAVAKRAETETCYTAKISPRLLATMQQWNKTWNQQSMK